MDRVEPLTDEEIVAAIDAELALARQQRDGTLGSERSLAYQYYFGQPFGNEIEGQSKVVSQLVMEVVDSLMPDLMKIFCGGENAVEFTARHPDKVRAAEQTTNVCNYVFYSENDGFRVAYEAIKDALLQKTGIFKYWWEDLTEVEEKTYEGVTEDQIVLLMQNPDVEIVAATPRPDIVLAQVQQPVPPSSPPPPGAQAQPQPIPPGDGMGPAGGMPAPMPPPMAYDVTIRHTNRAGKVCIETVPPDEFLVSTRARSIDVQALPFCAHEVKVTLSKLVEMKLCTVEEALELPSGESDHAATNAEEQARADRLGGTTATTDVSSTDPMLREVVLTECYQYLDADGDGIAELLKTFKVNDRILGKAEKTDRIPFAILTPKIMPHEFWGVSVADDVCDLQLLKSTLWRLQLDGLYLALYPRQQVVEGLVGTNTYADLLAPGPGRPVRVKGANAVTPMITPYVGDAALPMLEMIEQEVEGRTPVNRQYQGLPDNAINKTATSANIVSSRSQARTEMIARIFAETGFKELFRGIQWLLGKYQMQPKIVRVTGSYEAIDPEAWKNEYDMTVNVGLGLGNKQEQLVLLNAMAMAQQAAIQGGGMGVLVEPKHIYNLQSKIAQLSGFKDPGLFWKKPPDEFQPPPPQPSPQEKVAQINAQVEAEKFKAAQAAEAQKAEREHMQKMAEIAAEDARSQREKEQELITQRSNDERQAIIDQNQHALEMMKIDKEDAREKERMMLDAALKEKIELAKIAAKRETEMARAASQPRPNVNQ